MLSNETKSNENNFLSISIYNTRHNQCTVICKFGIFFLFELLICEVSPNLSLICYIFLFTWRYIYYVCNMHHNNTNVPYCTYICWIKCRSLKINELKHELRCLFCLLWMRVSDGVNCVSIVMYFVRYDLAVLKYYMHLLFVKKLTLVMRHTFVKLL